MRQASLADGKKRRTYITNRVDAYLRDKFGSSSKLRRPLRENCESCWRAVNFCKFCVVCSVSLVQVLAPWVLSIIEVTAVVLVYLLATSKSVVTHEAFNFSYMHSLEDIVALCMGRAIVLSGIYTYGMHRATTSGPSAHRPYLYTTYLLAGVCFPYILIKIILYRYNSDAIAAAALFIITGVFTWFHVFAARRTVDYARRSFAMSLAGSSAALAAAGMGNWTDGAGGDAWNGTLRRPDAVEMSKTSESGPNTDGVGAGGSSGAGTEDVPAESLADDDSRFLDIMGIKVHYKEFAPACLSYASPGTAGSSCAAHSPQSTSSACGEAGACDTLPGCDVSSPGCSGASGPSGAAGTAIVLVHGYGGGVFAWRHVMEALALQCQCRVVAFDRPGFGLTARPSITAEQRGGPHNPYALDNQVELMMQLCAQLGIRRVLLVAHADACLMALRAASVASKAHEGPSSMTGPSHISLTLPPSAAGTSPASAHGSTPVHGSSHAFSVLYSGSSAFIRPSFGSAGPAGAASSHLPSSTSANLPPTPPPASTSAAGSYGSSSVPQGNSSGSRTVLRMRAQAAPARERERDGSPPAAGPRLRSPRSPRSSLESTPGGPGSVSLPPLPPAPGSGPGAAAHDSEPGPSHAGSASHMQRGTCGNSLPPMAGQSAAGGITASAPSLEHWGAMSPAASLGDGPWSPCEVPTAGYAVSAAAAAAAAGWGDLHECGSSLDGNSDDGTCSHFQRQPGVSSPNSEPTCSHEGHELPPRMVRQSSSGPHPMYRPADCDVEAGLPPQPPLLHSHSSLGPCPRPMGGSVMATPLSTIALSQGQQGPRHRRTLSTGSGAIGPTASGASQQQQCATGGSPGMSCVASPVSCGGSSGGGRGVVLPWPTLIGMALLHPNLEPRGGPTLSRLLATSGLGSALIRPLLRSELGDVANRRAWYSAERLTPEVIELYRTPLRVQGWDVALMETVRLTREQSLGDVGEGLAATAAVASRPVMLLTAAQDVLVPPAKAEKVASGIPHAQLAVLQDCGHLSHEEAPGLLLQQLVPFCGQVLQA